MAIARLRVGGDEELGEGLSGEGQGGGQLDHIFWAGLEGRHVERYSEKYGPGSLSVGPEAQASLWS